jgi:integrase
LGVTSSAVRSTRVLPKSSGLQLERCATFLFPFDDTLAEPVVCASEETCPLSEAEARTFLEVARGDRFESLYVLAITTGLSRGELLELRWDNDDLERSTLRIGCSLVREGGRYAVGETKTKRGRRQVNLTSRTVAALKVHRKRQLEEKMKFAGFARIAA